VESTVDQIIRSQLEHAQQVLAAVIADEGLQATLAAAAGTTAEAMAGGRKLLVAGNGGSAADAQHLVAEFVCRLSKDRAPLRAVALTTDSSILTAVANDFGNDYGFARQIEALGDTGDVFLGISTSGNSPNVLRAMEAARARGLITIGLTGAGGGRMAAFSDFLLAVPSRVTMHIQQAHLALEHLFCMIIEHHSFGPDFTAAALESCQETIAPHSTPQD